MLTQTAEIKGGVKKTIRAVKAYRKKSDKAMSTAVRVTAYKTVKKLKKEIRQGAPGNKKFEPLTFIALRMKKRRAKGTALRYLANGVRYRVRKKAPYEIVVGWTAPGRKGAFFRKIAEKEQTGFTENISDALRKRIIRRGTELGKMEGAATPFFLRKTTTRFHTPARPIIEPFWRKYRPNMNRQIHKNFKLKMAGKRI